MSVADNESAGALETRPLDLSILIVTWNSERWLARCLRSIPAACEGLHYEVLIHDNASSDGTVALASGTGTSAVDRPQYRGPAVLRSPTNDGFAAGINRCFSESKGRYVLLLNPDCEPVPRAVTQLFEFLESHPQVAAAAPLLVDDDGEAQREFQLRRLPTFSTLAAEVLLLDKLFPANRTTAWYRYRDADLSEPQPIEQPAAAALLIRRDIVDAIGPFDEQFDPAWFEDVDYCRRLFERRQEIWVVPAARVGHHGGASLEHMKFGRFSEIWYRNMWRYAKKWLRPGEVEALRWTIVAGMAMRCVAALAGMRPPGVGRTAACRAWARVLGQAFRRWSES